MLTKRDVERLNLISPAANDIGLGDIIQSLLEGSDDGGSTTPPPVYDSGVVKVTDDDKAGYLAEKVDGVTVQVEGKKLTVKSVDGLTVGIADISKWLSGTQSNLQGQIDGVQRTVATLAGGMRYQGKIESHADMLRIGNKRNGDLVIVLADETRSNSRSMYVYSETIGAWDFVGAFEFSDTFLQLTDTPASYTGSNGKVLKADETNGKLVFGNVTWADVQSKPTSAITDIDAAVGKQHTHDNKSGLDRINVDGNGQLTIDGVVYTPASESKQHLSARRITTSPSLTTVNQTVVFNSIESGKIPYNTTTGYFTLQADKTYRIQVSAALYNATAQTYIRLAIVDSQGKEPTPNQAIWRNPQSGAGPLVVYITPTTQTNYRVVVKHISGSHSLYAIDSVLDILEV